MNHLNIFCEFYKHFLPYLTFRDIHPLIMSCKQINKIVDTDITWRHIVDLYEMFYKWDDFEEQDTGGTSVRCEISQSYSNIRPYIEFDANENEILTDAKGLVKFNVYQERKYPYQICCLSQRSVSSYVNDYPSEGEFE
jgi:hypothetical protein